MRERVCKLLVFGVDREAEVIEKTGFMVEAQKDVTEIVVRMSATAPTVVEVTRVNGVTTRHSVRSLHLEADGLPERVEAGERVLTAKRLTDLLRNGWTAQWEVSDGWMFRGVGPDGNVVEISDRQLLSAVNLAEELTVVPDVDPRRQMWSRRADRLAEKGWFLFGGEEGWKAVKDGKAYVSSKRTLASLVLATEREEAR